MIKKIVITATSIFLVALFFGTAVNPAVAASLSCDDMSMESASVSAVKVVEVSVLNVKVKEKVFRNSIIEIPASSPAEQPEAPAIPAANEVESSDLVVVKSSPNSEIPAPAGFGGDDNNLDSASSISSSVSVVNPTAPMSPAGTSAPGGDTGVETSTSTIESEILLVSDAGTAEDSSFTLKRQQQSDDDDEDDNDDDGDEDTTKVIKLDKKSGTTSTNLISDESTGTKYKLQIGTKVAPTVLAVIDPTRGYFEEMDFVDKMVKVYKDTLVTAVVESLVIVGQAKLTGKLIKLGIGISKGLFKLDNVVDAIKNLFVNGFVALTSASAITALLSKLCPELKDTLEEIGDSILAIIGYDSWKELKEDVIKWFTQEFIPFMLKELRGWLQEKIESLFDLDNWVNFFKKLGNLADNIGEAISRLVNGFLALGQVIVATSQTYKELKKAAQLVIYGRKHYVLATGSSDGIDSEYVYQEVSSNFCNPRGGKATLYVKSGVKLRTVFYELTLE